MKAALAVTLSGLMLFSASLLAGQERHYGTGTGSAQRMQNGGNADVIVDMPPEAWSQGQNNNQPPCLRCCTFENRQYSEGSVVKSEGVLLQCARDEHSIGTNNLIWKIVKQ
ncbi:hypothetical protein BTJ39_08610 [Izhakiella australiensis]|uniref:DUF1496 domain-containing protein n=1 Tax=Izhakiella australiensis TaxID=1926881 RepID=A0A1S8YN04_9GAMM|nr:YnjH family protein [Izhakiella australiensis]OON40460.1 hypothetical protein BTJ39_08610 [Izhakiella australiensis]